MEKKSHKLLILVVANLFSGMFYGTEARAVERITIDFEELDHSVPPLVQPLITRTFECSTPSIVYVQYDYNSGYPRNGGYYSRIISSESPWTLRHRDGLSFSAISIDVSEYSVVFNRPSQVTFIGYTADGNQVTKTVVTDGQIDGTGSLVDFETFFLGSEFENLDRMEISGISMIDNIVLELAGRPLTPPHVSSKPDIEDGVRLLWPNPMGYLHWIYRRNEQTGDFEKLSETRSSSFDDTNLGGVDSAQYRVQVNDQLNNVISGLSTIVREEPGRTISDVALGSLYSDLVGLGVTNSSARNQKIRRVLSGSNPLFVKVVTGNSGTGYSPINYRASRGPRFSKTSHFVISPERRNVTASAISSGYLTRPLLGGSYERISVKSEIRKGENVSLPGKRTGQVVMRAGTTSSSANSSDIAILSTYYQSLIEGPVRCVRCERSPNSCNDCDASVRRNR